MQKVIDELRYFNRTFPRAALEEAIQHQEEITPLLLAELDEMIAHPEGLTEEDMLQIYGLFLLAQFREKEAFSRILQLVSLPSKQVDTLFNDTLTEDLHSLLYSTFAGDFEGLKAVIENLEVNIYARAAALDAYGRLYADGLVTQEEMVAYLRELLWEHAEGDAESDLATNIQEVVVERHLFEMVEDVQKLYDAHRIDHMMYGPYDDFIDAMYDYEMSRERVDYIDDAIGAMDWWYMFEQPEETKLEEEERQKELEAIYKDLQKEAPASADVKVGRNDPCPCGSGKKYKKCCLKKELADQKKGLEPLDVRVKWLKDYPKMDGERQENEIRLIDQFDEEAIAIDQLVYLALHRRARPMWESVDQAREEKAKKAYLEKAFVQFKEKCAKDNIQSFEAYDEQHKIHYRSKDWVNAFSGLVEKEDELSKEVKETIDELA